MSLNKTMNKKSFLILGDLVAIAIVTIIGFATHGETGTSFLPRMAAAFFPVSFGWFLLAPWFGAFDEQVITDRKLLWRVPVAMLFAAPLAVILRAAVLGTNAIPVFALVLGSTSAFGMLLWRGLFLFISGRAVHDPHQKKTD